MSHGAKEEEKPALDLGRFPYLASLNAAQLKAVTAAPDVPLQILAGPGSGKTRVLTSRVAYLVQRHKLLPSEIVAVTFTNKAANEMKKRLKALLGEKDADKLVLGTFHATCARYLRRYGGMINLANNFAIADADDCKKIISRLIKEKAPQLDDSRMQLKDSSVLSEISKAKAREETPDEMALRAAQDPSSSTSVLSVVAELYAEYQLALRESNSLDFDDLLVFGLRLFREHPKVLEHCKHILVDEFQDTNITQYELMKCFAGQHRGVSVVGDPDQSIYGWRSAEIENLNKMIKDFPGCQAIYLEENYRSTGAILTAAHTVVSQDRERIQKSLYTSHPKSTPVCLKTFSTPVIEASFMATEIKRLIAYSGGVLNYGDFAILLRYNALSRVIEAALQKDSIPNRIVGGHKFFERMEIKDMLAYLQLAENPGFTPAFVRVVNVPKRGIGDKSVADLMAAAKKRNISPMELCELIVDGDQLPAGIKASIRKTLANFVGTVRRLRRIAAKGSSVAELIRIIIEKTGYEEYLRTSQQDWDSRWENIQELISYSVVVAEEQARETALDRGDDAAGFVSGNSAAAEAAVNESVKQEEQRLHPMFRRTSSSSLSAISNRSRSTSVLEEKPRSIARSAPKKARGKAAGRTIDQAVEIDDSDGEQPVTRAEAGVSSNGELIEHSAGLTPLMYFLQTSMLSTDTESKEDQADTPKVTISTVHAAKGLEWPVVFIPAVEQGTYPSYRCTEAHEIAEERRLLYVAMTRAQNFLSMSFCQFRMMGGEESDKEVSEFVKFAQKADASAFSAELPDVDLLVRRNVATMLGRPPPDEDSANDMIRKHIRSAPPLSMWDAPEPRDKTFNRFARREVTKMARGQEYWDSEFDDYALPDRAGALPSGVKKGFVSARAWKPKHEEENGSPKNSSPKPPPVRLQPSKQDMPQVPAFTFGVQQAKKREADLGMFTDKSSSFLDDMKALGVPEASSGPTSPGALSFGSGNGGSSPLLPAFELSGPKLPSRFAPPMADGQSKKAASIIAKPAATAVATEMTLNGTQLAKGTKRLGMGRPAPWGAADAQKRAKLN